MGVARLADTDHDAPFVPIVMEHDDGWAPWSESITDKPRPVRTWLYRLVCELAWPVFVQERHRLETAAIRGYQRELAFRAWYRRYLDAIDGWWAGPPPYGYQVHLHHVTDDEGRTRTLRRLVPDEDCARVVPVIFRWHLDGHGPSVIAARLAADPELYPPPRGWTAKVVRGLLTNPAYLGYVVHGRTRHGVPQPPRHWTWSLDQAHPALVGPAQFWSTYYRLHPGHRTRPAEAGPPRSGVVSTGQAAVHHDGSPL